MCKTGLKPLTDQVIYDQVIACPKFEFGAQQLPEAHGRRSCSPTGGEDR